SAQRLYRTSTLPRTAARRRQLRRRGAGPSKHSPLAQTPLRPGPAFHLAGAANPVLLDARIPIDLFRLRPRRHPLDLGQPARTLEQPGPGTTLANRRPSVDGDLHRDDPTRVRPRLDLQALWRRGSRDRPAASLSDARFLLQRVRRLVVPGEIETALGHV